MSRILYTTLLTGLIFLSLAPASLARTWLIKPDQTGDAPTIQAGIDSAVSGDTLALDDGTFTGAGNKDVSFDYKSIVVRSLSNDPTLCVIDCEAFAPDFHHAFVIDTVAAPGVVLKAISITKADGHFGGAVTCAKSSLKVVNCNFYDNFATYGGALYLDYLSATLVTSCVFTNNDAVGDGGISFYGDSLLVTDCVFNDNGGVADGPGAIWGRGGTIVLDHCLFVENWSRWSGAVEFIATASPNITNCTFVRNSSTEGGGSAIALMTSNTTTVERSILAYNSPGPAISGCGDSLYVACTDFYGNADGNLGEWGTCLAGTDTLNGNITLDPLFCDTLSGNYTLASASPCLPLNNPCGVLIGAYGEGCDLPSSVRGATGGLPGTIGLRIYPNPFNPRTVVTYDLPAAAFTTLRIYDVRGGLVHTLVTGFQGAGPHRVAWEGLDDSGNAAASGVYFLRIESGGLSRSAKLLLLK